MTANDLLLKAYASFVVHNLGRVDLIQVGLKLNDTTIWHRTTGIIICACDVVVVAVASRQLKVVILYHMDAHILNRIDKLIARRQLGRV